MKYSNRITPTHISSLELNQIFCFGSNLAGRHGRGAAKTASKWGALYGQASGLQGHTYAIPTKDVNVGKSLPIITIQMYVDEFINFAKNHTEFIFLVTEIGCGLAGFTPVEIAPLFAKASDVENIWLPDSFWLCLRSTMERQ